MAKAPRMQRSVGGRRSAAPAPGLPDPKVKGPFRPFTCDPDWSEAWWWLGVPLAVALFVVASYQIAPEWNIRYVTEESGILETAQFILMVMALALAVQLLFDPFVRRRPFVLAFTVVAALACLFIGGEEVSWGQHIFYWQEPDLVTAVNNEGELSLHNMNKGFERAPRTVLEFAVMLGGLLIPALCAYFPRWRQSRIALFLPASALIPTAAFAVLFKAFGTLGKYQDTGFGVAGPSEATEFYLYFFIFAYLIIFERRINALRKDEAKGKA
jgi:hypothetical protein